MSDQQDPYLKLQSQSPIIGAFGALFCLLGLLAMYFLIAGIPHFGRGDMALMRPILCFGICMYLSYGIFGIIAAIRGKACRDGFVGFCFFGINGRKRVAQPAHVSMHFIGVLLIVSLITWILPLYAWLF